MESIDVWCGNGDCGNVFTIKLESEDCGDGTEHDALCPFCGWRVRYEIGYSIVAYELETNPVQEVEQE